MIQLMQKLFHVVLWESDERTPDASAKFQFDTLGEAVAAFDGHRRASRYRHGILFHWVKDSDGWELIDRFPRKHPVS
jgi:hypothetical protein